MLSRCGWSADPRFQSVAVTYTRRRPELCARLLFTICTLPRVLSPPATGAADHLPHWRQHFGRIRLLRVPLRRAAPARVRPPGCRGCVEQQHGAPIHLHNLARAGFHCRRRLAPPNRVAKPDLVIVAFGMNDACYADAVEFGAHVVMPGMQRVRDDSGDELCVA